MRAPETVSPNDLEAIPDRPAVFLLWASDGKPYLARTAVLKRRLKRLLTDRSPVTSPSSEILVSEKASSDQASRKPSLRSIIERIEYWLTGSQIEAALVHLALAQRYFPDDWPRMTRLRPPAFVRLTIDNTFPRTMVTTRLGRGVFHGPFANRTTAENFQNSLLDLFQVRRCEENLHPSPEHPGCIYGEMNRCLRPCQQVVTVEEYGTEVTRLRQFLVTGGSSLKEPAELARDRASTDMQFEEAERMHQWIERIVEVQATSGELARVLDQLAGIAVVPSAELDAIELYFLIGGCWQEPRRLSLTEVAGAGQSLDHRLRDIVHHVASKPNSSGASDAAPNLEHLSILMRWYGSSWRDGEWLEIDWPAKIPYRKLVNAIGRVGRPVKSVPSN